VNTRVSGAICLARAAVDSGVELVTGYPGSPATAVVNGIVGLTASDEVQVIWNSNEKSAIEMAFGASLGGRRALLCVKSVGLNIALDPLMTINLSGCNAGFVILVGDDPGGWGSQNEQDSRWLAGLTEIPWLEPTTAADGYVALRTAFDLSEKIHLPVVVRITRGLAAADAPLSSVERLQDRPRQVSDLAFQREFMRWVVLPINVVPARQRLLRQLEEVQATFEKSLLNGIEGEGPRGIIAAGFVYQKLHDLWTGGVPDALRILRLGTPFPLPKELVCSFLSGVEAALVLEESAPVVERAVRATAQSAGISAPIFGRGSDDVPTAGELFAPELATALDRFAGDTPPPATSAPPRSMPSREALCEGCPYIPTFDALQSGMEMRGGRDAFIVVGDPGCMVRSQLPPYELLDVKHGLGSAIGMAAGLVTARERHGKQVVALCGDSGLLHTGLCGLVDAARTEARMLVIILDNGTTALSGGQPHPGSPSDARGQPQPAVDLGALARDAGAGMVETVDLDQGQEMLPAVLQGIDFPGLAVVIARGRCILYE
jgi:indolepyruvate ferredoxin oxidoreductase alpha subunit